MIDNFSKLLIDVRTSERIIFVNTLLEKLYIFRHILTLNHYQKNVHSSQEIFENAVQFSMYLDLFMQVVFLTVLFFKAD